MKGGGKMLCRTVVVTLKYPETTVHPPIQILRPPLVVNQVCLFYFIHGCEFSLQFSKFLCIFSVQLLYFTFLQSRFFLLSLICIVVKQVFVYFVKCHWFSLLWSRVIFFGLSNQLSSKQVSYDFLSSAIYSLQFFVNTFFYIILGDVGKVYMEL